MPFHEGLQLGFKTYRKISLNGIMTDPSYHMVLCMNVLNPELPKVCGQVFPTPKLPKTLSLVDHYEIGPQITIFLYYKSQRVALNALDHDLKRFRAY
jgi:hypothetical protein